MEEEVYTYVVVCRKCARTVMAVVDDPKRPENLASNADEIADYMRQGDKVFMEHIPVPEFRKRIKHGGFCEGHEETQTAQEAQSTLGI